MSATTVGALSVSKEGGNGFENDLEKDELKKENVNDGSCNCDEGQEDHFKDCIDNDEEDDSNLMVNKEALDLGPQVSLKEQLDRDKDDHSLKRWKEQLLGCVDVSSVEECKDPEVKMLSMTVVSRGRPDNVLTLPFCKSSKSLFTLKEGSHYQIKLSFTVSNNIVSGLTYSYTVWKTGIRVDRKKIMLGTYSPRQEPYVYEFQEDTTPSGIFVRGSYSVRTKVTDDDGKCYLDVSYSFEIQKKWS